MLAARASCAGASSEVRLTVGPPYGFPSSDEEEARLTGGEMIARSTVCGCRAPLTLELRDTLVVIRCSHCQRLAELHSVVPEGWR